MVLAVLSGLAAMLPVTFLPAASPPPPRVRAEVEAVLSRSPGPAPRERARDMRIVLLGNEKDHGPEEHDYPLWMKRWAALLGGEAAGAGAQTNLYGPPPPEVARPEGLPGASAQTAGTSPAVSGAPGVTVVQAWGWPAKEEIESADLIVAFIGTGGRWSRERIDDLRTFLDRGGGFVAVHSATIASRELARPLAELIGLAWEDGTTAFRHGTLDLDIVAADHPIALGLPPRIRFVDENYWPLVGDRSRVEVLATAPERARPGDATSPLEPQPIIWTRTHAKGRVFGTLLGHYTWTFDDPYSRVLLLRGMAWAGRQSPFRFDPLVPRGARVREGEEVAAAFAPRRPAAPVSPDPSDPRLLLWLDASDRSSVTVDPDGGVTDWSSKSARLPRGLSSWGESRPRYVAEGPGGRPALRFDGKDDILRDTGFRRTAKDWTLFIVASARSNAGGFRGLFCANAAGSNDYTSGINLDLGGVGSSSFDALNLEGIQHDGQSNLRTETSAFGSFLVAVVRSAGTTECFVDGAREGERGSRDVAAALEEVRIGGRIYENSPGKLPLLERGSLDGDVAEVVLYDAALEDGERSSIEAYLLEKYGLALAAARESTLEEALAVLRTFEIGGSRRALAPIDEAIAASRGDPPARADIEARLAAVLASDASSDAKDHVLRRLGTIGTAASIPRIAPLLTDARLSHLARTAIERIVVDRIGVERIGVESPASDRAGRDPRDPGALAAAVASLRAALERCGAKDGGYGAGPPAGTVKAGIVDSLGRLDDISGAPGLARLLGDEDTAVCAAAARALGRLGAADPLREVSRGAGPASDAALEALHDLAWRLLESGDAAGARRIFEGLRECRAAGIREGALRGLRRLER